jgi:hypothetical protein
VNLQAEAMKTDLTLSAVGELAQAFSGALTAEPGFPRVLADPTCPDCVARRPHDRHVKYADLRRGATTARGMVVADSTTTVPVIPPWSCSSCRLVNWPRLDGSARTACAGCGEPQLTESEQRALWGDR